jgi:hypothetical protein
MMQLKKILKLGVFTLIVAVLTLSCASSQHQSDLELDVDNDEIRLAISEEVARGLMEELVGADLECEGGVDGHMKALLTKLDRDGSRARASYRDGETTVEGRRRGGKLELEIRSMDSGRIEATMPWAIAECLLGNDTTIDRTMTSSIRVKVTNDDGRNFSFKLQ